MVTPPFAIRFVVIDPSTIFAAPISRPSMTPFDAKNARSPGSVPGFLDLAKSAFKFVITPFSNTLRLLFAMTILPIVTISPSWLTINCCVTSFGTTWVIILLYFCSSMDFTICNDTKANGRRTVPTTFSPKAFFVTSELAPRTAFGSIRAAMLRGNAVGAFAKIFAV